jgi:hypothetical protein
LARLELARTRPWIYNSWFPAYSRKSQAPPL